MKKNKPKVSHVSFKPKPIVLAVKHALPYLVALGLGAAAISPAVGRSGDSAAAFTATQLIRQFTLKNTVAQVSQGMQGYVAEFNGVLRASEMGGVVSGYPVDMGSVPSSVNLPQRDGAGRPLGYCAWDNSASTSNSSFLAGQGVANPLVYAVVSPGLNGGMETSCAYILANRRGLGDDYVQVTAPSQTSSKQFKSAVGTYAELTAMPGEEGDIRLVLETNKLYSYVGGAWQPVDASKFNDDSAVNGAGAIAYTTGKVTVADFQAASATITGALSGSAATFTSSVTANSFVGNGAALTDLNASNVNSGLLGAAFGGTGVDSSAAAQGSLLIGTGAGFALGGISAGDGIGVLNGAGSITISNTGVLSITGTNNQVIASTMNGDVVLSLPQDIATTSTPTFAGAMFNGNIDVASISQAGLPATLAFQYASDTGSTFYAEPNLGLGTGALAGLKSAGNVAIGMGVLGRMATLGYGGESGTWNTGVGYQALYSNDYGDENTAVGYKSLYSNTTGFYNTAIGSQTMLSNTTGRSNTAIGYDAMRMNTTGSGNTSLGAASLHGNTTGFGNVALGHSAMYYNTTGYSNSTVGLAALYYNTAGHHNAGVGQASLYLNTTGYYNASVGAHSLSLNTTGAENSSVGANSLLGNVSGNRNSALGYQANVLSGTLNYASAIGADSRVGTSDTVVLGALGVNKNSTYSTIDDQIVIGSTARNDTFPNTKFYVEGNVNLNGDLYAANATFSGAANFQGGVLVPTDQKLRFGGDFENSDSQFIYRSNLADDQTLMRLVIGDNPNTFGHPQADEFQIGRLESDQLTYTPVFRVAGNGDVIAIGTVTANAFVGDGSALTNLNANNFTSGILPVARGGTGVDGSAAINGQLLIGNGTGYTLGNITGTANQINVVNGAGSITLSLPQDIATTSTPTFAGAFFNGNIDVASINQAGVPATLAFQYASDTGSTFYAEPNLGLGTGALAGLKSAGNVAIGMGVLGRMATLGYGSESGSWNTGVGYQALYSNDYGDENTAVGYKSLYSNTTGYYNTAIGSQTMLSNTTGSSNTGIGDDAMRMNTTGTGNTSLGAASLHSNTTGFGNVALGRSAMYYNTTGLGNTSVGAFALSRNTTGLNNTALGSDSMFRSTTGIDNTAVGLHSLFSNTTGNSNVSLGVNALFGNATGSYNMGLGRSSDVLLNNLNYASAIGAFARVTTSNTLVLGALGAGKDGVVSSVNDQVVIGTTSRNDTISNTIFHVAGVSNFSSMLYATGGAQVSSNQLLRFGGNQEGTDTVGIYRTNTASDQSLLRIGIGDNANTFGTGTTDEFQVGRLNSDDSFNPVFRVAGNGDVIASGYMQATAFNVSSDRRLKTNIQAQDSGFVLSRLEQLQTYSYEYLANPNLGRRIGVIAQEIQSLFPETVATRADGMMSVDYSALGAMAAMGVGQLSKQVKVLDKTVADQGQRITVLDDRINQHDTRVTSLESWRTDTSKRMDGMQTAIDLNIQKIAENTVAIQTNSAAIERLDDALFNLDGQVKNNSDLINNINARWAKNFSESADGSLLTVNAVELKVSNFTAQQLRANSVYSQRLEAEMARIADLEVNNLKANSAVANTVRAEQVNTGSAQVYAGVGLPAVLFAAKSDGHYTVSTSALDGSYATATVIVNAGQAKVVSVASEGIELYAEGNQVKVIAAGKSIKASWIKMG